MDDLHLLEERLGYCFANRQLLQEAMTHRSWTNEKGRAGTPDNERLEFFGDALVDFLVAEYLFERLSDAREGVLTKMRAELVSEAGLARVAVKLDLGRHLCLGHGEELTGGRQKPSLLANALEALVGALYLDGGLQAVRTLLAVELFPLVNDVLPALNAGPDRKTALQESVQARGEGTPVYQLVEENGPPHQRLFKVAVLVRGEVRGSGCGTSKKLAEQAAAAAALTSMMSGDQS
jgi:ribonuclease-3